MLIVAILSACSNQGSSEVPNASNELRINPETQAHPFVRRSLATHYPNGVEQKGISFQFGDRFYSCFYDQGTYCFTRSYDSEEGSIRDTISNAGFFRFLEGERVELSASDSIKNMEVLNGVIYFAFYPTD